MQTTPAGLPTSNDERNNLVTILASTFFAMGVLYSPQPLLPFFARMFAVSEAASASLISWSMLSMSIGPLFMGYLLQRHTPRRMITWCLGGLAATTLLFGLATNLGWMKVIRFIQGGIIAAQLAATMTYIAGTFKDMRQTLAYYVGAAVMGGLSGRIVAGFVSEYTNWRLFFVITGLALCFCLWRSMSLSETRIEESQNKRPPIALRHFLRVLADPYIRRLYLVILCSFFVMTGVLNFVPFRLEELDPTIGESVIALFYLGFVAGFVVSINAPRIADFTGGTIRAAWVGMGAGLAGLLVGAVPSVVAIFFAVMLVTSGFFLQHTSIATLLNVYAGEEAGKVNSLYISIYYFGGTAGSYLPGLLYIAAGWLSFLGLLLFIMLMGVTVISMTRVPRGVHFEAT